MSTMEAELYAAAQGFNLLESLFAVVDEIEPGTYSRVLAIDNSSAVAMCQGGHGSQRTRHLKVRAQYIREAVEAGRLKVRHTPGATQLADLATKMVTKERLWELLGLWGFIGGRVAKIWDALKMKMMIFAMMIVSLVMPAAGTPSEGAEKEAIQISGADELMLVTALVCVAAIAIWELVKLIARWCWKWFKSTKKARKLDAVRRLAADAAMREDTLSLMTVEALQQALRRTGHPVTGLKQDLVARLSPELDLREPGPGSMQPSTKQLKYVLWLWRERDLTGRVALKWEDVSTRTASMQPSTKQLKYVLWLWRERDLTGRVALKWEDVSTRTAISS
eukprot:s15125_g1.t1